MTNNEHPHDEYLEKPNVIGVYERSDGTVVTIVAKKVDENALATEDLVGNVDADDETDVEEANLGDDRDGFVPFTRRDRLDAIDGNGTVDPENMDRQDRHRPVPAGVSEINSQGTAATGGHYPARVEDPAQGNWAPDIAKGDIVRLSNAHVYAREGEAKFGEPILQPSPIDGGDTTDDVGAFVGAAPLEDGTTVDVAARSVLPVMESTRVHRLPDECPTGVRRGSYRDLVGETLVKSGRTTGVTEAAVKAVDATVRVQYDRGTITLRNQILAADMSKGGDSGSPALTEDGEVAGQVFAGSDSITVLNRADEIEMQLGVNIMPEEPENHEPEQSYEDWKVGQLEQRYGAENVIQQHHLETGRLVDIIVRDPERNIRWAWELENDSGSVINGSGQAQYYAHRAFMENPTEGVVIPVLGVPAGHIDADERVDLEGLGVRVVEDDLPENVSAEGV